MSTRNSRAIEHLFQQAIDLPPTERSTFLDRACRSPDERREVEELIDAFESVSDSFLESPIAILPGDDRRPVNEVGRYPILGEVGRGGMGVVYRAHDPDLGRDIALKVLTHPDANTPAWLMRFRREARLLASLNHPNIATIHSLEEADGRLFLTMEFVEGTLLSDIVPKPSPLESIYPLALQLATALEVAHGRGVVHRDLKPANVIVTPDHRVKVLDFGLATAIEGDVTVTEQGIAAGTPGFMSPEQIRGEDVDPRSDLFSFGSILYQWISGEPAFGGDSVADLLRATLETEPDWSRLPTETPGVVAALIRTCLERERSRRPASASDVRRSLATAATLRDLASGEASVADDENAPPNLPTRLDRFVGRTSELRALADHVSADRLTTVLGPGGAGKSRLTLEFARGRLSAFPGGVWMVELAPVGDAGGVPGAIATAVGAAESGSAVGDVLASTVEDRPALLVLDNCEHLIDAIRAIVGDLLTACPSLRIVATSREVLAVPGERVYTIPPMESDAVSLFADRASRAAAFALTDENRPTVETICRKLDGMPLAVELAAARVRTMSPVEIERRLDRRFHLLASTSAAVDPRHRTLRAVVGWSFEQLEPRDRSFFTRLSVFAGGWTLEAAEEICAGDGIEPWEVVDALTRLVDKSLVTVRPDPLVPDRMRYDLLETLRVFARERCEDIESLDDAHGAYFLAFAERCSPHFHGPDHDRWRRSFNAEFDNLMRAVDRMPEPAVGSTPLRIAAIVVSYLDIVVRWNEGRRLAERLLALPGVREARTPEVGRIAHGLAVIALNQGDERVREKLDLALEVWEALGDKRMIAGTLNNLGLASSHAGDAEGAIAYTTRALEVNREIGNEEWMVSNLTNLAHTYRSVKRYDEAKRHAEDALAIARRIDAAFGAAHALNALALAIDEGGDLDAAIPYFEESYRAFRTLKNPHGMSSQLLNIGISHVQLDRPEKGLLAIRQALGLKTEIGDRKGTANVLDALSGVYADEDELATSARYLGASNELRDQLGFARSTHDQEQIVALERRLRSELGDDEFERHRLAGSREPIAELVARELGDLDAETSLGLEETGY